MSASEWAPREEGLDSARWGCSGIKAEEEEEEATPPLALSLRDEEEPSGRRARIKRTPRVRVA